MNYVRRWLSVHYIHRPRALTAALTLMLIAELGASIGIAYVAGFSEIRATFSRFSWPWLLALAGALLVSYTGYYYAYLGVYVVEGGNALASRHMHAVVTGAFGGFFAHGGGTVDEYAVEAAGATKRDAQVRAAALAGLEQGVLALGASVAAIVILTTGASNTPPDFTIPWAVAPAPGFAFAFWLAERYRDRIRERPGWRHGMGVFLDSIHLVRELFRTPYRHASAPVAMAVFWAADVFALWAGMAAFGFHMHATALIVAYATGMTFTRRTAPLAGAGILMLVLPLTLALGRAARHGRRGRARLPRAHPVGPLPVLARQPARAAGDPRDRAAGGDRKGDIDGSANPGRGILKRRAFSPKALLRPALHVVANPVDHCGERPGQVVGRRAFHTRMRVRGRHLFRNLDPLAHLP